LIRKINENGYASGQLLKPQSSTESILATNDSLIEAARCEGQTRWYTTLLPEATSPLVAAFEKRYPKIKIEVIRENAMRNASKIIAESKTGKPLADLFDGTTTAAILMKSGLTQPYKANSASDIPDRYKDPGGHWTATVLYFFTTCFNADLVSENDKPKTFEDLLDPKWRGKMLWSDQSGLTAGAGFVGNILLIMGQIEGMAYLNKLKKQDIAKMSVSANEILVAVAKGRYALGLQTANHHTLLRREEGFNVGWLKIEPLMGFSNNIGLVKDALHPNTAKLLINFVLSVEGQTLLQQASHLPANTRVEISDPTLRSGFKANYISPPMAAQNMDEWQAIFNNMFKD